MPQSPYSANITAGSSLMLAESRQVAQLLLEGLDHEKWHHALITENILQKRSPNTARRVGRLIRSRLESMNHKTIWKMVAEDDSVTATQALFACAIKHNHLIGDFLLYVLKEHLRLYKPEFSKREWNDFLEQCEQHNPDISRWSESTKKKIGQVIFHMLFEAQYIEEIRKPVAKQIHLEPQLVSFLKDHQENYVLNCMDIASEYSPSLK